jgi:hypothetical protein
VARDNAAARRADGRRGLSSYGHVALSRGAFLRRNAFAYALLALAAVVTETAVQNAVKSHALAFDFHHDFWVAGTLVRHGLSPFHWTLADIAALKSFPYPAFTAVLFVPFSLIPRGVGDPVFAGLCLVSCLTALWVLRVRDWRAYVVLALWAPFISGWEAGNLTLPLVLGSAAVWRYRDHSSAAGAVAGALVAIKPTVWPLLLFLLFSRRYRAAAIAVLTSLVLSLIAWSTVGFSQIAVWWHLIGFQTALMYRDGYGLLAVASHLGMSRASGELIQYAVVGAVALLCAVLSWTHRERGAFVAAVMLMLISSPLVDSHYFTLLVIPIAIYRPRLSAAFFIPFAFWFCPALHVTGAEALVAWGTVACLVAWLLAESAARPPAWFPGRWTSAAARSGRTGVRVPPQAAASRGRG